MGKFQNLYDKWLWIIWILGIGLFIYMYINPTSNLTNSYENVVNARRERNREFRQALGINIHA